jgi:DNA-binding transcriptional MerR regulator
LKINEVEQLLGISKANIRFYEKQGLLCPQRSSNKYREYSDANISRLKNIIILRKLGISVQDIARILNEEIPLQEILEANVRSLEEQIQQLQGSLNLSRQLVSEGEDSLDTDRYWEIIQQKESQGDKFADILSEYWNNVGYPLLANHFRFNDNWSVGKRILVILIICLGYAIGQAIIFGDDNFWINMLHWPIVIAACSAITFFIFWVGKKSPKLGYILLTLLAIVIVVILGGILLLIVGGGIVTLWNWIF